MSTIRRRLALLVLAPALLLGLAACGGPDHGVVHDKRHQDAYIYTTQICTSYGKYGCQAYVPQFHRAPPSWALDIYDGDEHGWRDVSEETYDATQIGDTVDFRSSN